MARQIQGSQTDFSFGEVDVSLKRRDEHPARKGGLRQMSNSRILNTGAIQNRPGRRALFPILNACTRIEKITMAAGKNFKIGFGNSRLQITDNTETLQLNVTNTGSALPLPWTTATLKDVVYAVFGATIIITFPGMRPQVVTWDGGVGFTLDNYVEQVLGGQKRTPFYRLTEQGVEIQPSAQTGAITLTASKPIFTAAHVGTRIRYVGRQILITAVAAPPSATASATVMESLPGGQGIGFAVGIDPTTVFSVGDIVIGSATGSKGIVNAINSTTLTVQLLTQSTSSAITRGTLPGFGTDTSTFAFTTADTVAGPGGALVCGSVSAIITPRSVAIWDDEVMNGMRGFPASCFTDQFRVGFCNFPAVPGGICWSAINSPNDINVGVNPAEGMFEIAPGKVQVLYVQPGPESSEFVFCDSRVYYIPISATNPLKPGSVSFQLLSGDGSAQVQPRLAQEVVLYINAGQTSMMGIVASGAYLRPFNTKNLSDFHGHLFNAIKAIAVPNADGTFSERYAYVLNGDGSVVIGKYNPDSLQTNLPVIGWGPWSGVGAINWIAAWNAELYFTSSYFGTGIFEVLDDSKYLDCSLSVNALPASFTPPGGKGPLWFIPSQSVALIDQVTRAMGIYQIDADGFIVPQFNGGEDLTLLSLVAGQPWTMTTEPFAPDATSGADMGQRMIARSFKQFAIYVINSTGFMFATLFSAKQTASSPALGTVVNTRRVPTWNQDDDATLPPKLRETVETYPSQGSSFDPRVSIIKDTPGPLQIVEIAMEVGI